MDTDSGLIRGLPLSSMRLLVSPVRLMSAYVWQVAQHRDVMHYGKLEEFVTLVTEIVPDLMSQRQRSQLTLGLRARLVLELCEDESSADLFTIQPHLNRIHTLTEHSLQETVTRSVSDKEMEAVDLNFEELVQTLLEDPSEKEHFFQEVFPVDYGPRYDTVLQILMWEFLSRLEELLPVPDFTQTAAWLGASPSVLEECGQAVLDPEHLKTLLQYHQHNGDLGSSDASFFTTDAILSTLSIPSKNRAVIGSEQDTCNHMMSCSDADGCVQTGTEREENREKMEGPLSGGKEQEIVEKSLTETDCLDEDNIKRRDDCLDEGTAKRLDDAGLLNMELQKDEGSELADSTLCVPGPSNGMNGEVASRILACSLCCFSHREIAELHEHFKTKHLDKDSGPVERANLSLDQATTKTDDTLPQLKTKKGVKPRTLPCSLCEKEFKFPYELRRHFTSHTTPFHCKHCEKKCPTERSLEIHSRIHTGEKPFVCSYCDRGFRCAPTLKIHVRTHTGERPYCCAVCGKRFGQLNPLKRHLLMHKGERKYLCSICGKAFFASGELMLHTRLHTGECPYTCNVCGKGFRASCNLKNHMRYHTGERPYSCQVCSKSFSAGPQLKRHMYVHTGEKPYKCAFCEKRFIQKSNMIIHFKSHKLSVAR